MNKIKSDWECERECGARTCWPICGRNDYRHLKYCGIENASKINSWYLEVYQGGKWRGVKTEDHVLYSWDGKELFIEEHGDPSITGYRMVSKPVMKEEAAESVSDILIEVISFIRARNTDTLERDRVLYSLDRALKLVQEKKEQ